MRDPEIIRRDIQIATLMAENLNLHAERDIARAHLQAHEFAGQRDEMLKRAQAFAAELTVAKTPPPAATPPSGRPFVVEDPVAPPGA